MGWVVCLEMIRECDKQTKLGRGSWRSGQGQGREAPGSLNQKTGSYSVDDWNSSHLDQLEYEGISWGLRIHVYTIESRSASLGESAEVQRFCDGNQL